MSASTRPVQETMGTRQLQAALAAIALAIALIVVVAVGQLTAAKPGTAPAAGGTLDSFDRASISKSAPIVAPSTFDRGWSSDSQPIVAPSTFDRGWSSDSQPLVIDGSSGSDFSNRARYAQ